MEKEKVKLSVDELISSYKLLAKMFSAIDDPQAQGRARAYTLVASDLEEHLK